MIIC